MENINNPEPIVKKLKQKLKKKMVLIDLNQNMINFQCDFTVQSKNVPFQLVVVTQEQLDSDDFQIEYQNVVNGIIKADIENVSNVYNNYCLLLKSDQECEVDIQINVVPLPETVTEEFSEQNYENHSPIAQSLDVPFYKTNTFAWIIIFVGIALIIYLLFSDNKKEQSGPLTQKIEIVKSPVAMMKSPVAMMKSPVAIMKSPVAIMKSPVAMMKSPVAIMKSPVRQPPIMKSPPSLLTKLKNTRI